MKRILFGLVLGFITACGAQAAADNDPVWYPDEYTGDDTWIGGWSYHRVATPFGSLDCVYADGERAGGPSCNWELFNRQNEP